MERTDGLRDAPRLLIKLGFRSAVGLSKLSTLVKLKSSSILLVLSSGVDVLSCVDDVSIPILNSFWFKLSLWPDLRGDFGDSLLIFRLRIAFFYFTISRYSVSKFNLRVKNKAHIF